MVDLEDVKDNLRKRDRIDTTRKESPLIKSNDAIEIDTTYVTLEEQVELVVQLATSRMMID